MRPYGEERIDAVLAKVLPETEKLAGQEMTEENLSLFASLASLHCSGGRLAQHQQTALYYSCCHLLGKTHPYAVLKSNMHRLVANWNFVHDGVPVPRWEGEEVVSDVLFLAVEKSGTDPERGPRYGVRTKLKTGVCAGIILWIALYDRAIYRFLDKFSGCSRFNCAAEEISGMRARITLSVHGNVPKVHEWSSTERQRKLNRQLTDARSDPSKCNKLIPCSTCRCTVSQCSLAVWADPRRVGNDTAR